MAILVIDDAISEFAQTRLSIPSSAVKYDRAMCLASRDGTVSSAVLQPQAGREVPEPGEADGLPLLGPGRCPLLPVQAVVPAGYGHHEQQ